MKNVSDSFQLRSSKTPKRVLALVCGAALLSLGACSMQPKLSQADVSTIQQCLAQQQAQSTAQQQQQAALIASLAEVQTRLTAQQQLLEAKPQIIEVPGPKVECPPVPNAATKKRRAKVAPIIDKQIVGLREQALVAGLDIVMQARISTGVSNSVLDARNIQMFERSGEEWVRFTVYNPTTKEPHVLERKRVRFQTVTSSGGATSDRRPVVEMRFTIGKLAQKGEFVLADRSNSEYPLLVGRNLLRDVMLVDVSGNNLAPLPPKDEPADKPKP